MSWWWAAGPPARPPPSRLARQGRDVMVVDQATFPRDKICGDGLTAGALRLLEDLGLDPSAVPSWKPVDDVVVRSPVRPRGHLPAAPRRRACTRWSRAAPSSTPRCSTWPGRRAPRCTTATRASAPRSATTESCSRSRGSAPSRRATPSPPTACGRRCASTSAWRSPGYRGEWHAFRQYFTGVGPRASEELFVWFEPDLLPGYAWSFPLPDGRANVGFGIQRDGGKVARVQDMGPLWPQLLAPSAHRRRARSRRAPGVAPPRLADPGSGRRHRARHPPHPLRRRRRGRHRPDDRRGHRAGAAHRDPRGRGRSTTGGLDAPRVVAGLRAAGCATRWSPTTGCRCC